MQIQRAEYTMEKGWYLGPWDSRINIAIGYAHRGIDEPHLHTGVHEVYLVAQGRSTVRVEQQTIELKAGDMLALEPGEAHTFLDSSNDYFHFVIQMPPTGGEVSRAQKSAVARARLGL